MNVVNVVIYWYEVALERHVLLFVVMWLFKMSNIFTIIAA